MDCFVSVEQFSDFEFLLQQMFDVQDHSVQKSIFDGVYFSKVASLHCADCNSTIHRLYCIYFLDHVRKLPFLERIFGKEVYGVPTFK